MNEYVLALSGAKEMRQARARARAGKECKARKKSDVATRRVVQHAPKIVESKCIKINEPGRQLREGELQSDLCLCRFNGSGAVNGSGLHLPDDFCYS